MFSLVLWLIDNSIFILLRMFINLFRTGTLIYFNFNWWKLFCFVFRQRNKFHPDKKDISSPCGFEHIVSIGSRDYSKFFSLQTFVSARQFVHQKKPRYGKSKWAPQPPKHGVAWVLVLSSAEIAD